MEGVQIDFSGGNISISVEQSSVHTTTTYVIGWHVWGSLVLGLLILFIALRGRRHSDMIHQMNQAKK
jgi:hypothetical protein